MPRSPLYADPYTPRSPSARSTAGSSILEEVPRAFAAGYGPDSAFGSRNRASGRFFSCCLPERDVET